MKSNAFLTANRGATALEYGLIAAGVGVAIAAAVFLLGGELATLFNRTSTMLPTAPDGGTGEMRVVARNNFADGREGWTGGVLRTLEQIGTGLSLARNENGGRETVSRSFDIPAGASRAEIGFDMAFVDSWDNEEARIFVNGAQIGTGTFRWSGGEPELTFTPSPGITASAALTSTVQAGSWSSPSRGTDYSYRVSVAVEDPGETLTLGFGTTLDQPQSDESLLIGNVEVRADH